MRISVIRLERKRPGIAGSCRVKPALIFERIPQVIVGLEIIRIKQDRLSVTLDRSVQIALCPEHISQVVIHWTGWICADCLADAFNGDMVPPRLICDHTRQVPCIRVVWLGQKYLLVNCSCLGKVSSLMVLQCSLNGLTNVDSLVIRHFSCAGEECLGDFREKLSAWAQQGEGVHRAGREHAEPSCGVVRYDFGRPEAAAECGQPRADEPDGGVFRQAGALRGRRDRGATAGIELQTFSGA